MGYKDENDLEWVLEQEERSQDTMHTWKFNI